MLALALAVLTLFVVGCKKSSSPVDDDDDSDHD